MARVLFAHISALLIGIAYRVTDALEVSVGTTYVGGIACEFAGQRFDQNHWNAFGGMRLDFWAPVSDEPRS